MENAKNMPLKKVGFSLIVLNSIFLVSCCFADGLSESYSELLRKAVTKAQRRKHGSGFGLLHHTVRHRSGHSKWEKDPPEFTPLVDGLDDPNAVPFLVKVIYEGPDWDKNVPTRLSPVLGIYRHIGRCYSVLSLAVSGDPIAFSVLSGILENDANFTDPCLPEIVKQKYGVRAYVTDTCLYEWDKEKYDIRAYAAAGLGMLGDSNAVELLLRRLSDKNRNVKHQCLWALGKIGDVRTIKPILEAALHDEQIDGLVVHVCIQKMTKVEFDFKKSRKRGETTVKEFPELGNMRLGAHHRKEVWQHWFDMGRGWTEREFEKRYQRWREIKHKMNYRAMEKLGIAALPFMIEKIKEGEKELIPLVSLLVDQQLREDASQDECLAWWEKNKQKWLMPFEEDKKAKKLKDEGASITDPNEP